MLSATLAVKRKLSSATKAISERSCSRSTSRTSTPSTRTVALARVVQPRDQRDEARLAGPRRPDQRHRLAGVDLERDVVQRRHRLVFGAGRRRVAEGHVAQLDPTAAGGQLDRVGRALDRRFAVDDLEHPVARGDRALRHPHRHAEHPQRPGQHHQVGVEGGEVAEAEVAFDHHPAADQQHQRDPELRQQPDQRAEEGLQAGRVDRLVEDPLDRALEAVELEFLAGEGLDDADPGDVLLGLRGQFGDPLGDLLDGGPRDPVVARGDPDDERRRDQRQRRQQRVDDEHHRRGEDDRQQVLGDEDRARSRGRSGSPRGRPSPATSAGPVCWVSKKPSSSFCRCA